MRVLLVSNSSQLRCGIAQMGRRLLVAMRGLGIDITDWDALYPKYLPPDAAEYDVIHLNWHPHTINHIVPQFIPKGPRLSILWHEMTPKWTPDMLHPLWYRADLNLCSEPVPGAQTFLVPVPDYSPYNVWQPDPSCVLIGNSSIRRDGLDWVMRAVEKHPEWRLELSDPDHWLSDAEEIQRLARCALNVYHYHSGYFGQSAGVVTAIAARRPILINSATMLRTLWDEPELYRIEDAEEGIQTILADIAEGKERRPFKLAERRSWTNQARYLKGLWEAL